MFVLLPVACRLSMSVWLSVLARVCPSRVCLAGCLVSVDVDVEIYIYSLLYHNIFVDVVVVVDVLAQRGCRSLSNRVPLSCPLCSSE